MRRAQWLPVAAPFGVTWRAGTVAGAVALLLVAQAAPAAAQLPRLDPADLALAAPRIDPDADAEALAWSVRVTDDVDGGGFLVTTLEHQVRIKVFTARGRDAHSRVDLTYTTRARVRDVEGRTIAPDGTITELRTQDIFDRTLVRANGIRLRAKSFVLPAVVPGAVIEYRWREIRDNEMSHYLELPFQRDIPVHLVRYYIKPLPVRSLGYRMRMQTLNVTAPPDVSRAEQGYTLIEARNMTALRSEPFMPPELAIKEAMLVYYAAVEDAGRSVDRFWNELGRAVYREYAPQLRVTPDVRRAAAEATQPAQSIDDRIAALVRYVRARVARPDLGAVVAGRRRENKTATDTLRNRVGTRDEVTVLFAALAGAAGLETKLVLMPDRSEALYHPDSKQPYFLSHLAAAIRTADGWRFVDAAHPYTPDGHLGWQQEGLHVLLLDERTPEFTIAPLAPTTFSVRRRTATLTLRDNGTLEGEIALEYTGHAAAQIRERDAGESLAERERFFTEDITQRLPGAELSSFSIDHLDDPDEPYRVRFTMTLPGYAQRTGTRLFVQPAVMQRGAEAMFAAGERHYAVYLPYPWSEEDTVTINLPDGYDLEPDSRPAALMFSDGSLHQSSRFSVDRAAGRLTFTRVFFAGGQNRLIYPTGEYAALKRFFDAVQNTDGFTLALRRREPEGDR